ncbi:F-box/kelch-repeat protein SKIP4-like [Eucalyptus grandis]|uniref:F-box/kelch-repeat protein SKIP4-like n=1 Tax=Eucalyptus grandis TaxID=71139 RepID=UPI00192EDE1E|nr:F-box/kelch-repeat protein SKIP4-like [Eucalyptus grandis]
MAWLVAREVVGMIKSCLFSLNLMVPGWGTAMGSVLSRFQVAARNEPSHEPLIPSLPDDVALFCLARVPRKFHPKLRLVCKQWRDMVWSDEWYSFRRYFNFDEALIFALCGANQQYSHCYMLDPSSSPRLWKHLSIPPQISPRIGVGFGALGKKIYLLGGYKDPQSVSHQVYCCDVSANKWCRTTSLSIPRCYFACEVLDEKIYAIGGSGTADSWDTYDPCTNGWISQVDPILIPNIKDSVVLDGQIYIRCGGFPLLPHVYAIMYKPSRGSWQHVDADMASGWKGPAVVIDGALYVLDYSSGLRLMKWRKESKDWVVVKSLSQRLIQPPCRLVAIGKELFVIGKGLSTLMFNVDQSENSGEMVESSISPLTSNYDVISCKVVAV